MAIIQHAALARQVRERVRPRCEVFAGLAVLAADDLRALQAIPIPAGTMDDGSTAPIPFAPRHWTAYIELLGTLSAAYTAVKTTLDAAVVRPIDLIVAGLSQSRESALTDPATKALVERIRPRATVIRSLRYRANDDVRILSAVMDASWDDADPIDEERNDGVAPITVGLVRTLIALETSLIGASVNTESVAQAIDAACDEPLGVD